MKPIRHPPPYLVRIGVITTKKHLRGSRLLRGSFHTPFTPSPASLVAIWRWQLVTPLSDAKWIEIKATSELNCVLVVSKNFPTDPWSIPQIPNQQFMKELLSFGGLGMSGVCSRCILGLPEIVATSWADAFCYLDCINVYLSKNMFPLCSKKVSKIKNKT